jgi:hypothetical protein
VLEDGGGRGEAKTLIVDPHLFPSSYRHDAGIGILPSQQSTDNV